MYKDAELLRRLFWNFALRSYMSLLIIKIKIMGNIQSNKVGILITSGKIYRIKITLTNVNATLEHLHLHKVIALLKLMFDYIVCCCLNYW